MEQPDTNRRPVGRLITVTGVSGSGRGSTLRVLEDLGFYCIDNLPVALAPHVIELATARQPGLRGVALGIDPRERLFFPEWPSIFAKLEAAGYRPEVIFLDCSDEVLARRYSITRRPHPLAESGLTVTESIRRERLALAEMRERADRIIDTTNLSVHELREVITAAVLGGEARGQMVATIVSFGFKYGIPVGLDLVFDVRFLANPYFVPELRELDGNDDRVRAYVMKTEDAQSFLGELSRFIRFLIPRYRKEGKSYLTIGIGCTGGRHRSPVIANELVERLKDMEIDLQVRHHDISRSAE